MINNRSIKKGVHRVILHLEKALLLFIVAGTVWAAGYDIFVSVHHNIHNSDAQGAEVLVRKDRSTPNDQEFAEKLSANLAQEFRIRDRGVKQRSLAVLGAAKAANPNGIAVLSEAYFMQSVDHGEHFDWSDLGGQVLAGTIIDWLK